MRKFIATVDRGSRNILGEVGRPIATGLVTGLALGPGLTKATMLVTGNPVVLPMWAVVGTSVLVVAVTETGLRYFGRHAEVDAKQAAKVAKRMAKGLEDMEYKMDLKKAMKDAGLSEPERQGVLVALEKLATEDEEEEKAAA